MDRRKFIAKTGIAAAGAIAMPYILPSGRLFAATGTRKVNHVVFCMFAGGVRNLESIQKAEGNLMPAMFSGTESISPDIASSIEYMPASPLPMPLQNYGTLFKNFKYAKGPTGHYNGHTTAITGQYTTTDLNIKDHPEVPTVFEYYRKHNSPSGTALNAWWVPTSLGPYPALNFSKYAGYGAEYGANFVAPLFLFSEDGNTILGNPKVFTPSQAEASVKMRNYLDKNFLKVAGGDAGVTNLDADKSGLQNYIVNSLSSASSGAYNNPWGIGASAMNADLYNIFFAEEIIKLYKPELLVVNMQGVDVCHSNFSSYCNNLHKADYGVAHLWNLIQSTPGMANDTVMIVAPEHGRNQIANTLKDGNGRYAVDHTAQDPAAGGDQMARDIFCLVLGPSSVVKQNNVVNSVVGESVEIVPAIANMLGFDTEIPGGLLKAFAGSGISQAFY